MPKKKHKPSEKQLQNLVLGRKRARKQAQTVHQSKVIVDRGTSMHQNYTRHNPSPAMKTTLDNLCDHAIQAQPRIDSARDRNRPRSRLEVIMLIQFVLHFVLEHRCTLTLAVTKAAEMFRWSQRNIYPLVNDYINGDSTLPEIKLEKTMRKDNQLRI